MTIITDAEAEQQAAQEEPTPQPMSDTEYMITLVLAGAVVYAVLSLLFGR